MFLTLVLFVIGFYVLIKGADFLIKGASSLAHFLKVSPWVIGVVIVGIGTSIPEFSITIASLFDGTAVGMGTLIGSNIFNVFVILGLAAAVHPTVMQVKWIKRDFWFHIIAGLAVIAVIYLPLSSSGLPTIERAEGISILILGCLWLGYMIAGSREKADQQTDYEVFTWTVSALMIMGGLVGVFLGGKWVVDGAEAIARALGASEALIGLTILGIGTSVPELAVSIKAAINLQTSIAVGTIVGSNIFNFLGIMAVAAVIKPLTFPAELAFDLWLALGVAVFLLLAMYSGTRNSLDRWEGRVFILLYVLYLVALVIRG